MSTRTYQDAVKHLNSLQSNAATLEAVRASGGRLSEFAIPEMIEYLGRVGYTVSKSKTVTTDRLSNLFLSHNNSMLSMLYTLLVLKGRDLRAPS